jgi:hypothetical protein
MLRQQGVERERAALQIRVRLVTTLKLKRANFFEARGMEKDGIVAAFCE